jgi:hypothetical protein
VSGYPLPSPWDGIRHVVGPPGASDRPGRKKRRGDQSYPIAGHRVVTNTIRVVGRPPLAGGAYAEGRVV